MCDGFLFFVHIKRHIGSITIITEASFEGRAEMRCMEDVKDLGCDDLVILKYSNSGVD